MTLGLILVGLLLLGLPGQLDQRRVFGPARFARLGRTSLTLGFVGVVAGLALWGAPALFHWADALGVPGLCDSAIHRLPLGGLELAIAMAAIAIAVSCRVYAAMRKARLGARRARVDHFFGRHSQLGTYDLVVIPSERLLAVGVPGHHPQIVVTEGLVAELPRLELEAVIRHEVAHHRLRHRQYLLTAAVVDQVFGWIPPVRSSTTSLRNAVEQWADIESTKSSGARIATLRSALERLATRRVTTIERDAIGQRIAWLDANTRRGAGGPSRLVSSLVPAVSVAVVAGSALLFTLQIVDSVLRCRTS